MLNRRLLLAVAVCLVASLPLGAQTFRGTILGTISDSTGAVVVGAKVTITNVDTGVTRSTTTDDTGFYTVTELPIGNYSVTVEKEGFQTAVASGIRVEVAVERRVDVALQPGALAQRTEVVAAVPLVETTANVLGGTLQARQVEELPLNGRDFGKLLVLVPGASGSPDAITDFPGSFGLFTTNGSRGRANNFLLDGTDMNDGFRNLPAINEAGVFGTPATILPLDAIAEARVLTNFEPEYGRNGGAVVNIVTKSGTNDLHGSLYEFFRNTRLNARNFFNNVGAKDSFHNNNFGVSVGGPLKRNRTFFFFSYEGARESGAITTLASVPDPSSYAVAGNPVIQNLLNLCASSGGCSGGHLLWPAPTPGFTLAGGLNAIVPAPFDNRMDSLIGKIDHNFNQNNILTGRYFFGDSDQSFPLGLAGGNNLPGTNTFVPTRVQLISVSYVHVFSATRVNEIRVGWNRFAENFLAADRNIFRNPLDTIGLATGVGRVRDYGLPQIRVSGFASLGSSPFSNPRGRIDTNWHVIDNYGWKTGRHDFKFGFEFRRTFISSFYDAGFKGRLNFPRLSAFLAGTPSGGFVTSGTTDRNSFQNSWAGYIQDSFRVTNRFTFNWGLRYDYYGVLGEKNNRFSRYDPLLGLIQVGSPGYPRLYNRDPNNFGPRVSFAWDPWGTGKTVFRAGWGLFYDAFSQDFFVAQFPFNTFNAGAAHNPMGPTPELISFSPDATIAPSNPVFNASTFATDTTDVGQADPRLRTPYIQNFNVNLQRELWKNTVLQVAYVGSLGTKLFRTREINQSPVPGGARPFDLTAPLCPVTTPACPVSSGNVAGIVNQVETSASSNYHSLQVTFTQRNWHGWTNNVSYTWGHSIDTASDGMESVPNQSTPDNSQNSRPERASSNFDTRQRFVWNWIYDIPKFTDRAPKLTQGWQISGILTLMSGHPFNVNMVDSADFAYDFIFRPDLVGNPFLGRRTPDRYLNLAAFALPCTLAPGGTTTADCISNFHYGSLPRNFFIGPDFRNFDLSIAKTTNITERVKIQVRADFYNFTNHANFSTPTLPAFLAAADFQGITPGGDPSGLGGRGGANGGATCLTSTPDAGCFLPIVATPDTGVGYPQLGGGGPRNIQFAIKVIF